MPIQPLNIFTYFNRQRFTQFGCMDCANWYGVGVPNTKKTQALYPAMGRKHITYFGENKLIFPNFPRAFFRSIDYMYVVLDTQIIQVDRFYNERIVGEVPLNARVWCDYLSVGNVVHVLFTAETKMYVLTENSAPPQMVEITDPNRPRNPLYVAAFGNRMVVSNKDTPEYYLSVLYLGGDTVNPNTCFTIDGAALFNSSVGKIRQLGVLHNQLYIFTDFNTQVLANIPTQIQVAGGMTFSFPFKVNTSYNWDYGIADPLSLSIDFGRMCFEAKNRNGLVSFMVSDGQQPQPISSQAVNVILQNSREDEGISPFQMGNTDGFLYQYEGTIFYRVSAGQYQGFGDIDRDTSADSLEYNFSTQTWGRVIELNGERNRIQKHLYFNDKHLVILQNDNAIYEMAGNIYHNELRNPNAGPQDADAFIKYPMRYKLITEQIVQEDYSEFMTEYVEIDFVFGDKTFYQSNAPFANTTYIVDEESTPEGAPIYLVTEDGAFIIDEEGNTPSFPDNHYNQLFKPHIELYLSDDGGITFHTVDNLEFSPLGAYRWRMRWYQLGVSRNRSYQLDVVSSAPIVVLGAVQSIELVDGGAN